MLSLTSWWSAFSYSYRWSDYVMYIDGWIPKLALSVPILGYMILFNDKITELLVFKELANEDVLQFGLSGIQRIRLVYFGLIFLGVSNFIYRIKRPYVFDFGTTLIEYMKTCFDIFAFNEYIQIHNEIKKEGALTPMGRYGSIEWDGFIKIARTPSERRERFEHVIHSTNWEDAKNKYSGLLRNMLSEQFFRYDIKKRYWLSLCLGLSTIGYLMLIVPGVDIFAKVLVSTV